jgi:hypothetical protein
MHPALPKIGPSNTPLRGMPRQPDESSLNLEISNRIALDTTPVKSKHQLEHLSMKGAAYYRIRVRGELDTKFSDRLEGMHIETSFRKDGRAETVLEGCLNDQSAFSGVLNTLYDMHLPVVSADCLGAADEPNGD